MALSEHGWIQAMTEDKKPDTKSIFPGALPKWILFGSLIPGSVLVSIIFDYGYFLELGLSFGSAPTSVTDHVTSWLLRLPYLVGYIGVYTFFEMLVYWILETRNEESRIRGFLISAGRRSDTITYRIVVPLSIIMSLPGEIYGLLVIGTALLVLRFANYLFSIFGTDTKYRVRIGFLKYVFPIVLMALGLGQIDAKICYDLPSEAQNVYTLELESGDDNLDVEIFRTFEEWLLVRDESQVGWINKDGVLQIDLPKYGSSCVWAWAKFSYNQILKLWNNLPFILDYPHPSLDSSWFPVHDYSIVPETGA